MNILLTGQCTLHWGRMEYGNIGNYYIIEPFIRELHRVFPNATIKTTFQMSEDFCRREKISCLPMDLYYDWTESDLKTAQKELTIAASFSQHNKLSETTPYIDAVMESNLVIDFSGDIWGDNANLVGPDRFLVGLLKDRIAQLLGKPTVMLAGSPGPFKEQASIDLAKTVYENFSLVTNRESISKGILENNGFNTSKTKDLTCPAFLFEAASADSIQGILSQEGLTGITRPKIGFIICGWNMIEGPFDKFPRADSEYELFAETVEFIEHDLNADVVLMSHNNGFEPPPNFKMIHGRDFNDSKRLHEVLQKRGKVKHVHLIRGIYQPAEVKAIINSLDMLISGRVHAAVAGLSQFIPTVIIDYGHEPKAHKLQGFAQVAAVKDFIANPASLSNMKEKIIRCWNERIQLEQHLRQRIPIVKSLAQKNFELLKAQISNTK